MRFTWQYQVTITPAAAVAKTTFTSSTLSSNFHHVIKQFSVSNSFINSCFLTLTVGSQGITLSIHQHTRHLSVKQFTDILLSFYDNHIMIYFDHIMIYL